MKKLFCFALATLILLTALVGCNVKPVTPPDKNPTEQPGTTDPGNNPGTSNPPSGDTNIPQTPALKDDEIEKTTEHTVGNGKFIFNEKKYAFNDQNLVLMDVKNETDTNYTLTIHYTFYDEAGNELLSKSREFIGIAAGWQRPILLWNGMAFDSYSYTIETKPYEGECFGVNYRMEYVGLRELKSKETFLIAEALETNTNTSPFLRVLTTILFDNEGNVYGIYPMGYENINHPSKDNVVQPFIAYSASNDTYEWPEILKGDLRVVFIPYYGADTKDSMYLYDNSDHHIFFPDESPKDFPFT